MSGKKILSWERRRVILEAYNAYVSRAPMQDEHSQSSAHRAWEIIQKHLTQDEKNKLTCGVSKELSKQIREDLAERLLHGG